MCVAMLWLAGGAPSGSSSLVGKRNRRCCLRQTWVPHPSRSGGCSRVLSCSVNGLLMQFCDCEYLCGCAHPCAVCPSAFEAQRKLIVPLAVHFGSDSSCARASSPLPTDASALPPRQSDKADPDVIIAFKLTLPSVTMNAVCDSECVYVCGSSGTCAVWAMTVPESCAGASYLVFSSMSRFRAVSNTSFGSRNDDRIGYRFGLLALERRERSKSIRVATLGPDPSTSLRVSRVVCWSVVMRARVCVCV